MPSRALNYVKRNGITTEEEYPYVLLYIYIYRNQFKDHAELREVNITLMDQHHLIQQKLHLQMHSKHHQSQLLLMLLIGKIILKEFLKQLNVIHN